MPAEGDFRRSPTGEWQLFFGSDWLAIKDQAILDILRNFDGVKGTQPNQEFSQRGVDAVVAASVVLDLINQLPPVGVGDVSNLGGQDAEVVNLADEWRQRGFPGTWPPLDLVGNLDTSAVKTLMDAIALENRLAPDAEAQPRIFDLAQFGGGTFVMFPNSSTPIRIDQQQATINGQSTSAPIEGTDSVLLTLPDGTFRVVSASEADVAQDQFQLGQVQERGGFQFVETSPGNFQRLPDAEVPQEQGGVVTIEGRQFVRQPDGTLTPLAPESIPTVDQMITEALLAGDVDGAIALADFQERPNSMEAFQAALNFAASPGETAAISAIARGHQLVSPPPAGEVQRIAEPPEFLQDTFQKLMADIRGGGGTPNELVSALERASKRSREDTDARGAAEDEVADMRQSEQAAKFKELFSRTDKAEQRADDAEDQLRKILAGGDEDVPASTPSLTTGGTPTAFSEGGTGFEFGGTPLNSEDVFARLLAEKAVRDATRGAASDGSVGPADFPQSRDTVLPSILTPPGSTPKPGEVLPPPTILTPPGSTSEPAEPTLLGSRVIDQAGATVEPTRATSGFFTGLNAGGEDDFMEEGGVFDDRTAVVGEDGPEIVVLPVGTTVLSNTDSRQVDDVAELKAMLRGKRRKKGKKQTDEERLREMFNGLSLEHGGTVESLLPIGVRQALRGGVIEPTRRRLSTAAGIPVLSGQARQNLFSEELDVLDRLRAEAGIPEGAFLQEQQSALPGAVISRPSRFAARIAR